ncbi:PREDICTED: LOW QUALITY PROTEIN: F-box/LRR-repeat protein At2g43260 [Camelina sativa]|uniref:LOW QUALITY PROTEIN: F-box/LRR-repeat protein At2g43260 n=1 Tax=Camelina sativa TaxID=90675 RepID=A0ABM1RSJ6_CAMSA|nr:PREDICTED: LOW QUALITY PROTEIN: F-box/LRR-repeat protein At2g43260 [Camelina sativa]
MREEERNLNPMDYLVVDLLEEIFLRLPCKSILKLKTISKQWRSILESRRFMERRVDFQAKVKILAVRDDRTESGFEGDEEIEMVYLHCDDDATRPLITFEGLVCIPEPGWINVLNPTTRQLQRFPCTPDHPVSDVNLRRTPYLTFFSGNWAMGFGRDKVTDRYKVVRMCFGHVEECEILDLETGEWRKLNPPPHKVDEGRKSVCINGGSIYWLHIQRVYKVLALDLHKEEYRKVPVPATSITLDTQIVNLEDRLVLAITRVRPEWILEIWGMDRDKERWSKSYSISLDPSRVVSWRRQKRWFTPVAVSKQGNLVFYDNKNRRQDYYPRTDVIRCLSLNTCVMSPYMENLVPLPLKPSHPLPARRNSDLEMRMSRCRLFSTPGSWISKVLKKNVWILDILFTSLVVVGYICLPLWELFI